jgi:hypothetical protein
MASTLKWYIENKTATNSLDNYVDLVIERGSGTSGTFSSCTGFTAAATEYTGTLAALATTADFATGKGSLAIPSGTTNTPYRIKYTINASAPNSTMASTAQAGLTWELRSN